MLNLQSQNGHDSVEYVVCWSVVYYAESACIGFYLLWEFLPEHYASQLDRYGKFLPETEPKLAWYKDNTGSYRFLFQDSFQ